MKIAITGKGGTGKTTLSALLGYSFSSDGKKVFLIDADPDGNLGLSLGFSSEELSKVTPISEMKELIHERTEYKETGFFKLNPKVDDVPEKFSLKKNGLSLLILGTMRKGGAGCFCPENAFLKSLLSHLLVANEEIVILDMPAGIEHLGRGTAGSVDCMLVVVEPTLKSIQTAERAYKLATDIKLEKIVFVGNKITSEKDLKFIEQNSQIVRKLIGYVSYSQEIVLAEQKKTPVYETAKQSLKEISALKEKIGTATI
ncbi:MAG: hypothetical protein AUJ85_04490 [Elusimicrobia bacterium CG1_02_37_114]|nr:MAG: hypothetical protein AUJ85_04490 [Elusimicrobia bacterium CG1_02_37_114]PIV52971.1 MAG: carbon monoxide dehydrogenase [Elusimicrobia bacterium CG02_land_8_20_14_3_00_37_13]PIZ14160.1 MAG: carbon monoxide dehydrogenase [Elusimicrobia bacterium CG_4_10_14_0_8_um_filter_37_32]